jgi:ABC-2 type transport system ATP-binding protein
LNIIETFELTKFYNKGKVQALFDFTLQVEKGKIYSLLGPNGAGKTTLIKILIGIVHPTRGGANILGRSITDPHIHEQVGYLAENHRFPDFLSAGQILYYYGKMAGVEKSILKERIPQLLQLVKLDEWTNTKIRKYSKGMLQRVGLAHALSNNPELLFLDEPTDGIDPVGRREIRDLLKSLRDQGKTIFLNSHLLSEVERMSDEIAILKDGKLLEKGSVEDFTSIKEQYQFQIQNGASSATQICRKNEIQFSVSGDTYTVSVKDEAQLNFLIDEFRLAKITICAIVPRKITLEDFFIDIINDKQEGNT